MQSKLAALQQRALKEPELKAVLLETRKAADPMDAFCKKCQELGYEIYIGELLAMGEEFCAAMLRSQNGGGVEEPNGDWGDAYEHFFTALER